MIKKLLLAVFALLLVSFALVFVYLDSVVKSSIEYVGPQVLGTEVTVDAVSLSPLSGSGSIDGLLVGNPEGFSAPYIFELGNVSLALAVGSVFSDVVEITSITIDSPVITYETQLRTDNVRTLMAQLSSADASAPAESDQAAAATQVVIRDLQIINPRVNLVAGGLTAPVPLPDIRLQNIGEESDSVSLEEALRQVLAAISQTLLRANLDQLREATQQQLQEQLQRGTDAVNDNADRLRDGVRNLLRQ
ncbi:MAG: hypothetical protein RQ757_09120 [Pseudomonadales bacterium]|nr:hypothetical protein [Pseudomonadales bacterium]